MADGRFQVGGRPFLVVGVGWDPARPGELPWTRPFVAAEVDADFARMKAAGFNTVRTWAPMRPEELALAARHGLRVLQGIWTPPDADFADPALRRRVLGEVARVVESSRWSPAVLGYLVLNEPRARAVAHAGLAQTQAWLREIAATVRALDPSAPVGYASWPGMEALDDGLLDFVAFNLYPHRPRAAMDGLGMGGYVRLLQRTVARGRPFLVSEFGVSVAPGAAPGRGGASEAEQAEALVELSATFAAAGAAGAAVFQWNDGWWKNHEREGDELTHDADDPEEWFGLLSFAGPGDRLGQPRPALEALARQQRAVWLEPREGAEAAAQVPVRLFAPAGLEVAASLDGRAAPLALARDGEWLTGAVAAEACRAQVLELELRAPGGAPLRVERRALAACGGPRGEVRLSPRRLRVAPGERFSLEVRAEGAPDRALEVAAFAEDRFHEQEQTVRLDRRGSGRAHLTAPPEETILTVLAFDRSEPPRAAWATVEVRREE